jgi:Bacterial pre-peptidase C-terminal domain
MPSQVRAEPPTAMYLFPAGGQRGTTVNIHAGGLFLNKSCNFEIVGQGVSGPTVVQRTTVPHFEGPVLPLPESQRQEDYPQAMAAEIKIAADANTGNRHVRMWTSQGVTLPLPFVVGDLPEIVEQEIEGDPIPVAVSAPVTINGRIYPREDEDHWSVKLKKGQTLSCAVVASSIGSPLDARLEIRDVQGRKRAECRDGLRDDPRMQFTAPEDGEYQVAITDVRSDGGPAFVYRLTLRIGNVAEGISGKSNSGRVVREADEQGDPVRANFLPIPATGVGRIAQGGEVDSWSFSAKQGENIEIGLKAQRLGSPLIGVLSVRDSSGKSLGTAEATNGDPTLRFTAPANGTYSIAVQDRFKSRGGPDFSYRLHVDRPRYDFELTAAIASMTIERGKQMSLKLAVNRRGGMNGLIHLQIEGLPPGVTAPKESIIAVGQATYDIPLKVDATAAIGAQALRIKATAWQPLLPFTAMPIPISREVTFQVGEDRIDHLRLAVAIPTPFKIVGEYQSQLIPRGTIYSRKYRLERNGFTGPVEISLTDKQARHLQGVTAGSIVVPADKNDFEYSVQLPPWMETGRTCRVCVMGTATLKEPDGSEHVVTYSSVQQNDQIIAVIEPERLCVKLDRETLRVEPNGEVVLDLKLSRGAGLSGAAAVEVIVPAHFKGVTAERVHIPADANDGKLRLRFAKDSTGPFNAPLLFRAVVLDRGLPVTAESKLELVPAK